MERSNSNCGTDPKQPGKIRPTGTAVRYLYLAGALAAAALLIVLAAV